MRAACVLVAAALAGCGSASTAAPTSEPSDEGVSGGESTAPSEPVGDEASREDENDEDDADAVSTNPGDHPPEVRALARAFEERLTVSRRRDGTPVLARRCREGPVDCRARLLVFAAMIRETAARHDVDPFLIAALAIRESGLDPSALGRRNEAGIVQLHPRGAGRDMRYVQDAAYRDRCQTRIDACQGPVLERGVSTLATAIEECGGLIAGLGAYATGHCTRRARHPRRVLQERDRLRRLARGR